MRGKEWEGEKSEREVEEGEKKGGKKRKEREEEKFTCTLLAPRGFYAPLP